MTLYLAGTWFFAGYLFGRPNLWPRDHWSARLLGCLVFGLMWPGVAAIELWLYWTKTRAEGLRSDD